MKPHISIKSPVSLLSNVNYSIYIHFTHVCGVCTNNSTCSLLWIDFTVPKLYLAKFRHTCMNVGRGKVGPVLTLYTMKSYAKGRNTDACILTLALGGSE
jgi:hypothetical protein